METQTTPQPNLVRLLRDFPTTNFDKGEIILFQGEVPRDAYIIKRGLIKVYNIDDSGREQLIYFKAPPDVFPFTWIMGQVPTTQYFYEALTDCTIYKLPRERYVEFISANKELLIEALKARANLDHIKTVRLNAVLHPKAIDKLIYTLHCLALSHGSRERDKLVLNFPLSQQDFANMTGLTRETVSIEFSKLKKSGLLSIKQARYYQLDPKLLKEYLNDQFLH